MFEADPSPSRNDQITRATSLVRSAVAFSQAIREDRLAPDEIRGMPLCMNQYWWLFGVARVPTDDGGRLRLDPDARHVVVLCRGQIYSVTVLEESSGRIIPEHELSLILKSIVDDAQSLPIQDVSEAAVGLLTTENQKVWSRCRKVIVQEGLKNGRNLGLIDSSLFVLCLDDSSPQTRSDVCKNMISGTNVLQRDVQVGTCVNRWYDKLAIIVCRNGEAGMNFEHTCTDGSVDIRMACDIYKGSISPAEQATDQNNASSSTPAVNGHSNADHISSKWQKLSWDIPSEISAAFGSARAHLVDRIQRHQLETVDFEEYGKTSITRMGFSPDAFFQLALHAAYYGAYGCIRSGFEPVQMRPYLHGRTDVVRTTTREAAAFARLFREEHVSAVEKVEAMQRAAAAHVAISKDCAKGLSHHRHLYVLQQMWKRRQAFLAAAAAAVEMTESDRSIITPAPAPPTIFTDPGWTRLGTTIVMGSNVDNPYLSYAGFGPPADEGFTVCYFIRPTSMHMSICSRNGQAKRYGEAIAQTFRDLRDLLEGFKN